MNLTDSEVLKFQRGSSIFIDDICAIKCATLGEIVDLGYDKFQQYLSIITATKPIDVKGARMQSILDKITDFQYLLMLASSDAEMYRLLKEAFNFFIHENVSFSLEPAQIVVGDAVEKHILVEEKFYELQQLIKKMYFINADQDEIIISPTDSPEVKRLKQQMIKNREKVRLAKAKQAAREKKEMHFSDLIGSVTLNHCNLSMENIWNITYYAFQDQLKRMGWRDQFDINNRAALAGAKMKKNQLKHWMRSITDSDKS